jgi:general stress protein 26
MRRWKDLARAAPDMADAGRRLLYDHGVGLGFLATVRKDGGPRVHPVCPVIDGPGLYVFIGNHSHKVHDLLRDGRFALHSFPIPEKDDEFYVAGTTRAVNDDRERSHVYDTYSAQGTFTTDDTLFELLPERALYSAYAERGSWPPAYTRWLG